jgi:hypothetical protein
MGCLTRLAPALCHAGSRICDMLLCLWSSVYVCLCCMLCCRWLQSSWLLFRLMHCCAYVNVCFCAGVWCGVCCVCVMLQVAAEFLADVPVDAPVWGWKEPQAIYTLPFLLQVGSGVCRIRLCLCVWEGDKHSHSHTGCGERGLVGPALPTCITLLGKISMCLNEAALWIRK